MVYQFSGLIPRFWFPPFFLFFVSVPWSLLSGFSLTVHPRIPFVYPHLQSFHSTGPTVLFYHFILLLIWNINTSLFISFILLYFVINFASYHSPFTLFFGNHLHEVNMFPPWSTVSQVLYRRTSSIIISGYNSLPTFSLSIFLSFFPVN